MTNHKHNLTTIFCLVMIFALAAAGCSSPETATATDIPVQPSVTATPQAAEPQETAAPEAVEPTPSIAGSWEGVISVSGLELKMSINFTGSDDELRGLLDIPEQGLYGYELANLKQNINALSFEAFEELNSKAVWDGKMTEDGKISGEFSQMGYVGTFELTKMDEAAAAQATQTARDSLPYTEQDLSVNNGGITLGGTLSLPQGEGPFPVIVLITGSGAQNRDEEIFGFKLFGVIADHLTRAGVAVLRYDDRGVGASTGDISTATSADFAGDALAWVEYLKTRQDINPQAIGLMGHSEGGIVAPLAASQSEDIAFLILMAGTAQTGEEIIYQQVELIARAGGSTDEEIEEGLALQRQLFDGLLRDGDWEAALEGLRQQTLEQVNALPDTQKQALGDIDQFVDTQVQQQAATMQSPWYMNFLTYDPVPVLEQTTIPVLALFGGLDLQVPAETNAELMRQALSRAGNHDVTVITYPTANHLFQDAVTGSPEEYAVLEPQFVDGFLDDLASWLKVETALIGQ